MPGTSLLFMNNIVVFRLLQYIGRETAPSPATGSKATHYKELKHFLAQAMSL